jgi:hypothetical protein
MCVMHVWNIPEPVIYMLTRIALRLVQQSNSLGPCNVTHFAQLFWSFLNIRYNDDVSLSD